MPTNLHRISRCLLFILVFRRRFQLLKAASPVNPNGRHQIGLRSDQQSRLILAGIKVLEDDALQLDGKLQEIPFLPVITYLIQERITLSFDDDKDHSPRAFLLAAAACRGNFLAIKDEELM